MTNFFLGAAVSVLLTGCLNNVEPSANNNTDSGNKEQLVEVHSDISNNIVVLCDVSNSIDSNLRTNKSGNSQVFEQMKNTCKSIIKAYPPNTQYYFFFVSQNAAARPFLSFISENWSKGTKYRVGKSFKNAATLLEQKIDSAIRNNEKNTCLMTSIEHCFYVLNSLSKSSSPGRQELIILSDMIEECNESPVGKIMMTHHSYKPLLTKKEQERIQQYSNPAINFDKESIRIKVLFNTSGMNDITKKEIMKTWRIIFSRYGYKEATTDPTAPFLELPDFPIDKAYQRL